jgi:NADH:ubiquinone oxidoreductase subunit 6 (subunit J)
VGSIVFWALAVLAVGNALLVFRLDSMARVTFALLAVFLFIGGQLILLGLVYLGVVVILMMVIEMVIMAVFMVAYMMNPAGLMPMSMVHNKRAALAISLATFAALAAGILTVHWPRRTGGPPPDPTRQLGESLMGDQMLTMITLGFALFATILAATVLATHRGRYERYGDDLDRPAPDDPIRGGVGR